MREFFSHILEALPIFYQDFFLIISLFVIALLRFSDYFTIISSEFLSSEFSRAERSVGGSSKLFSYKNTIDGKFKVDHGYVILFSFADRAKGLLFQPLLYTIRVENMPTG